MAILKRKKQENKPLEFESFSELLIGLKVSCGNKTAFRFKEKNGTRDITYAEFCHDVFSLRQSLELLGIAKCHIACVADNSYEWINTYFTVLCSSGVFVPIDTEIYRTDITDQIIHSGCSVVFYSREYEYIFRDNEEKLSNVKYFIGIDRNEDDGKFLSFEKLRIRGELEKFRNTAENSIKRGENEPAMLIYTSGTTGESKGVLLSEKNLISCIHYGLELSGGFNISLSLLPYYNSYQAICCILGNVASGAVLCTNDNVKNFFNDLRLYHPDTVFLVPSYTELIYKRMVSDFKKNHISQVINGAIRVGNIVKKSGINIRKVSFELIHSRLGGNLKRIICGGAPLSPEAGDFFEGIGIPIYNGYGITECTGLISLNTKKLNNHRTVGVPLSCLDIIIKDPDEDGNGEIAVKGDTVMTGYYKNEELTAKAFDENGYFLTGDYGHFDDKERIVITGRKNYVIVLPNGKNIYPEEIESCIRRIPYVEETVVYARKNKKGREIALIAEVYLGSEITNGFDFSSYTQRVAHDVAKVCKKLPVYKQVSDVVVRAQDFPKTATNKIKRNKVGF